VGKFEKWQASLQRDQALGRSNVLNLKMAGQFTRDRLAGLEKINLGGPYSVRAYSLGVASGERSKFASATLESKWFPWANTAAFDDYLWRDIIDVLLFVDYGKVSNVGSLASEELSGFGFGLSAEHPLETWKAELLVGFPDQKQGQFDQIFDDELNECNAIASSFCFTKRWH